MRPGRPRVSNGNIGRVRETFQRQPVARASRELGMLKMTVWKVLHKRICLNLYKMRLMQDVTPADEVKRREFCEKMQLKMEEDCFVERLIFSYEATFHITGKVSNHMSQIEHQSDSPKVRVFLAVSREKAHGPFSSLKQL
jgi:hypothetical protein